MHRHNLLVLSQGGYKWQLILLYVVCSWNISFLGGDVSRYKYFLNISGGDEKSLQNLSSYFAVLIPTEDNKGKRALS